MKLLKKIVFLSLVLSQPLLAQESFVIKNIQVKGIQRITRQTLLNYVPVHSGQKLTPEASDGIIEALYKTGFFTNVEVSRQANDLVISVVERPTIARISVSGNKEIKTKKLLEALQKSKIAEGQIFDAFMFKSVEQAIAQQYTEIGQYQAGVNISTTPTTDNRVNVHISINEGQVIKTASIQIEGNKAFKTSRLLKEFSLTTPGILTWFDHKDRYTREKLDADLENLTNFYLDNGYLKFRIDATDVDVKAETKKAYIKIQVTEGKRYKVSGYELSGRLLGQEPKVQEILSKIKPGEYFSRSKIIGLKKEMDTHFANQGYAFASTHIEPVPTESDDSVFLKFIVEPGEQIYVRRINFSGNYKTQDLVYRQEMRIMEAAPFSADKVAESRRRLMNLPYVGNVTINQVPVDQTSRQIDLQYKIKEVPSENINAKVGYGNRQLVYALGFQGPNFLGTGRTFALGLDNSTASQHYYVNYTNPYFTPDGISQGFGLFYDKLNPKKLNINPTYSIDKYGLNVTFGIPVSEFSRLSAVLGYENINLHVDDYATRSIRKFVRDHGTKFDNTKAALIWTYSYLDRAPFPTKGVYQSLIGEAGVPVFKKNLKYYKARYDLVLYQPLISDFIFTAGGSLAAGTGYGSFSTLPFFMNYYAGGIDSVAGFKQNTLGPRDYAVRQVCDKKRTQCSWVNASYPIGGNVLTTGKVGIILPQWLGDNLRFTLFGHGGNVFQNKVNFSQLRYSAGLGIEANLPLLGIVQLSLAKAFHKSCARHVEQGEPCDEIEVFQFNLGASL